VRAADLSIDATLLWTCAALSAVAAAAFAFLPGVPGPEPPRDAERSGAGARLTRGARRRQRVFAVAQIAACYVLLAGAGLLLRTLLALQATAPGFETESVLAVDVPVAAAGRSDDQIRGFYDEIRRRVSALPGVTGVAVGSAVPWRDGEGLSSAAFAFTADGAAREDGGEDPRARFRSVSPGFFPTLGIPLSAGRDFNEDDRAGSERVVIVSEAVARRLFAGRDAVGRTLRWTDERMRFIDVSTEPRRIVGVAPDIRDEAIGAEPPMTVYHPFSQEIGGGRLFVHAAGDSYALVPAITRIVRDLAADQPVERASTLEDIRADVLAPSRLNAVLLSGFALLALAIALVGVAGMLGFWVSGRTREFGIRMAVGSRPRDILTGVLREGAAVAIAGVGLGLAGSLLLRTLLGRFLPRVSPADPLLLALSAAFLALAAVAASAVPASRAARVDVVRALRAE
jgi:predicted permease